MIETRTKREENKWNYGKYIELEKLFAWAYFYKVNRLDSKYDQVQIEIEKLRKQLFNN